MNLGQAAGRHPILVGIGGDLLIELLGPIEKTALAVGRLGIARQPAGRQMIHFIHGIHRGLQVLLGTLFLILGRLALCIGFFAGRFFAHGRIVGDLPGAIGLDRLPAAHRRRTR